MAGLGSDQPGRVIIVCLLLIKYRTFFRQKASLAQPRPAGGTWLYLKISPFGRLNPFSSSAQQTELVESPNLILDLNPFSHY